MPEPMFLLTSMFVFVGALFVAISVPLIRRRVKPNRLYGLRVRATFADEHVWYEANARSGRDLSWLGVCLVVLALVLPLVDGMTEELQASILVGVSIVGVVVLAIIGITRANRLLREERGDPADPPG